MNIPLPFEQVCNGCRHGATNYIPGVLSLLELVMHLSPSLLEMLELVGRPGVVEVVQSFDVVQNDLVTWVDVFVAVQVTGAIKQAPRMMSKMRGQCLSESCSVSGCQPLCFSAPECHRLYAPFVKS